MYSKMAIFLYRSSNTIRSKNVCDWRSFYLSPRCSCW